MSARSARSRRVSDENTRAQRAWKNGVRCTYICDTVFIQIFGRYAFRLSRLEPQRTSPPRRTCDVLSHPLVPRQRRWRPSPRPAVRPPLCQVSPHMRCRSEEEQRMQFILLVVHLVVGDCWQLEVGGEGWGARWLRERVATGGAVCLG